MNELVFPISLDYLGKEASWGPWHIVRELGQNAFDADPDFRVFKDNGTLVVEDGGESLEERHLILGVTEKDEADRGKFGEGLKLALLILTRMGYGTDIASEFVGPHVCAPGEYAGIAVHVNLIRNQRIPGIAGIDTG